MSTTTAPITNAAMSQTKPQAVGGVSAHDFLLFYPSATGASVKDAIHALYYLPKEYKLVVGKDASLIDTHAMTDGDNFFMDRILFDTTAGIASPFMYASAIIYGDADYQDATAEPHIVVSSTATKDIEGDTEHGFTVAAGNPEALASAAMLIAKGRGASAS